ncbi:MAG TPA: hypothetical protein PKW92_11200, partial [Smithella sp.]|nr:hypothetical protein [Smithella sp.]
SPSAQTVVIADLSLRQDLLYKTLSIAARRDIWATAFESAELHFTVKVLKLLSHDFFLQLC